MSDVGFALLCARTSPTVGIKLLDVIFEWRVCFEQPVGGPVRAARGRHRHGAVGGDGARSVTDFVLITLVCDLLQLVLSCNFRISHPLVET